MNAMEKMIDNTENVTYCLCPLCSYIEKYGVPRNRNERRRMEKELEKVLVIP